MLGAVAGVPALITAWLFQPGGTYLVVVHYDVALGDLPGFGLLSSHQSLHASFAEPIDPYASR